jgi:hypothetical protein
MSRLGEILLDEEPPVRVTAQELPDLAGRLVQVPLQVLARQFWRRGRRSTLRLRLGEEGRRSPPRSSSP